MVPALPERLRLQFLGLIGEEIRPWLDGLPDLVARLCREWDVELEGMLENGWSSYVAFGTRQDVPIVLKVAPNLGEGRAEIAGLLVREGVGVLPLLCHDFDAAALLAPRVRPGTPLQQRELDPSAVAALLRGLHVPVEIPLQHVPVLGEQLSAHWTSRANINRRLSYGLPDGVLADAATSAERLCRSCSRPVLLHGDFEARNVLHGVDGLVAIDSPAVVGDPGYDAASWVLSEHEGDTAALRVCVTQLTVALDYPEQRLWQWAWSLAVDGLLTRLHEPGWTQHSVNDALAVAREAAQLVAPTLVQRLD